MASSTKAWSGLDRKATAVAEFTLRQYRTRLSTWVVLASCVVALGTVLLFPSMLPAAFPSLLAGRGVGRCLPSQGLLLLILPLLLLLPAPWPAWLFRGNRRKVKR